MPTRNPTVRAVDRVPLRYTRQLTLSLAASTLRGVGNFSGVEMKITSLNVNRASPERMERIATYLLQQRSDFYILTEFLQERKGAQLLMKNFERAGYKFIAKFGILLAGNQPFVCKSSTARWIEVTTGGWLSLVGVYFPDKPGSEKDNFWHKVFAYANRNAQQNALVIGDFNSYTAKDAQSGTEKKAYSPHELRRLDSEFAWKDLWEYKTQKNTPNRYTWFSAANSGVRLDYAFVSPALATSKEHKISITHDAQAREKKPVKDGLSDHSAIVVSLE